MRYLNEKKKFPTRQIILAVTASLGLALLSALFVDQKLSLFFRRPELTNLWLAARAVTNVGLSEHYFVLSAVIYVFTRWAAPQIPALKKHASQVRNFRLWSRDLFGALILSGILIHVTKFLFGRQRPHLSPDCNPYVFHPFTFNWDYHSFGSGHSQVLFTVATVLTLAYPKGKWLFIALAAAFSFTRVIIHDHFLSDVIGGACVGYVGAVTAVYWMHKKISDSASPLR